MLNLFFISLENLQLVARAARLAANLLTEKEKVSLNIFQIYVQIYSVLMALGTYLYMETY